MRITHVVVRKDAREVGVKREDIEDVEVLHEFEVGDNERRVYESEVLGNCARDLDEAHEDLERHVSLLQHLHNKPWVPEEGSR